MISEMVLEPQMKPIQHRIKALLEEGTKRGVPKCKTVLKAEALLWAFTKKKGIEPTNNIAERAIRSAVLWKKRSFGVESERSGQYVEAMLSIWATSRLNGVSPIVFLKTLLQNYRTNSPTPSILYHSL